MEKTINLVRDVYGKYPGWDKRKITDLLVSLEEWCGTFAEHNFLHPCLIGGRPALVCMAKLSVLSPHAYESLLKITDSRQLLLVEDRRSETKERFVNRRAGSMAILAFCFGLASTPAQARSSGEAESGVVHSVNHFINPSMQHVAKVGFISGQQVVRIGKASPPSQERVAKHYFQNKDKARPDPVAQRLIGAFLEKAYRPQPGDPKYIQGDLRKMAKYYSRFASVISLFKALHNADVHLYYKRWNWSAQALGTRYSVNKVNLYFDSRIGANLWLHKSCHENAACHVSPADALLHELLHAKLMLLESRRFISKGGMRPALYLFDHEKEVIGHENRLYSGMSRQDGLARPLRKRHQGKLIRVACSLCTPGKP